MKLLLVLATLTTLLTCKWSQAREFTGPVSAFTKYLQLVTKEGADSCKTCREVTDIIGTLIKTPLGVDVIKLICIKYCESSHMEDTKVCKDAVKEFSNEVVWVMQQFLANPNEACPLLLEDCGSPEYGINPYYNWTVALPDTTKPPNEPLVPPPEGSKTMRVLHLSDPHIDYEYQIGSEADCDDPLCCRKTSVPKVPVSEVCDREWKLTMAYWWLAMAN